MCQDLKVHVPNECRSMAPVQRTYHAPVNALHLIQKVNQFPAYWARVSRPEPPYLGQHPTLVCFSFLFIILIIVLFIFIALIN